MLASLRSWSFSHILWGNVFQFLSSTFRMVWPRTLSRISLYCRLSEMIIFSCTVDIRKAMDVFMLYKTSSNNHPLVIYFKWITPATHTENCLILTTQKLSVLEVLSTIDRLTTHLAHIYVHVDTNSTHTPIKHSQILNWSVDSEIQGRQVEAE